MPYSTSTTDTKTC